MLVNIRKWQIYICELLIQLFITEKCIVKKVYWWLIIIVLKYIDLAHLVDTCHLMGLMFSSTWLDNSNFLLSTTDKPSFLIIVLFVTDIMLIRFCLIFQCLLKQPKFILMQGGRLKNKFECVLFSLFFLSFFSSFSFGSLLRQSAQCSIIILICLTQFLVTVI